MLAGLIASIENLRLLIHYQFDQFIFSIRSVKNL